MFSIFWLLVIIAIPLLVVVGIIILFSRVNKLQADVTVLKQILYKQSAAQQSVSQSAAPLPTHAIPAQQSSIKPEIAATKEGSLTEEAGGRWLGKLGVLAIILGVSFFLKDAFENNWIGPSGRVLLGIIGGVVLLVIGQIVRTKYKNYSDLLVGGSYGIFYLTTFGAFYFYNLISAPVAYGFFVGITALSVIMSVVDKSALLASVGVFGGFLAPLLLTGLSPKGVGALAQTLSYILIINIGVAVVAYVYKWKVLSFLAFVGTIFSYLIAFDYYFKPEMRAIAFVFITLYFIIFLFVSIAHHIVRGEKSTTADIFFISLNALQYGMLGAALVQRMAPNFLGYFCVAVSLIYLATAMFAWRTAQDDTLLNLYLPGIATIFLTIAIPAQFDGNGVLIAWLIEALVIVWVSQRTGIKNLMYGGFVVFLIAVMKFITQVDNFTEVFRQMGRYDVIVQKIDKYTFLFNENFFYVILVSITGGIVTWSFHKAAQRWGNKVFVVLAAILFVISNVFLLAGITGEVQTAYRVSVHNRSVQAAEEKFALQGYQDLEGYRSTYYIESEEVAKRDIMRRYYNDVYYEDYRSKENQREMVNSIIMAIYAAILLVVGFTKNSKLIRISGLVLIFITALYIFVSIWDLGSVYRIITALIFGIIALLGSFGYARFSRMANSQNN